ncbi:hypothetical protein E3N88_09508 [Mikania micrantha]|uniref:Uncharacterized protein n=1 Tax=Mikania micrantha TaxID=192012 RepID=A0A5N6PJY0_9ASTR|nr:hypothetical protein E3N88_09508 [Mikania micrantha]
MSSSRIRLAAAIFQFPIRVFRLALWLFPMNNWMNRHHRVEDKELDDLWKTMSRWLEAGLLQSLWHSDSVHSFRILTPISTSPSIVSTLRSLSAC